MSGASKLYIEDIVDDFCDNYIVPCVQAHAVYENKYLLGTAMARPAIAKRLVEIASLKKHIINYSKTRPIYEEYRKAGYSKKFLEAHREEITIHRAAKAAFDELGVKKLPKVKELSAEYAEVLGTKRRAYAEYRQAKNEARELLVARKNISSLYEAERKESGQDRRTTEQSR